MDERPAKFDPDISSKSTPQSTAATSRPLVPLVPAQRRTEKGGELGVKHSSKVRQGSEIFKPIARYARTSWTADKEIRGHHSAPWHGSQTFRGAELRESKSAPDLREPVLAAIRGLQDGSIQVDLRTRAKIAHAARRVLKTREIQRRGQQSGTTLHGLDSSYTSGAFGNVPGRPPSASSKEENGPPSVSMMDTEEMASSRDLSQNESRTDQGVMTGLSKPPPGRQRRSSYPFTVTTGVPVYPQGDFGGQSVFLSRACSRSTPSTGLQPAVPSHSEIHPNVPHAEKPIL